MKEHIKNSEFYHFGILPNYCIHSIEEDEYSKMYVKQEICDCGSTEWKESCTMILGYFYKDEPIIKNVHRCKKCNEIRMAKHIGLIDKEKKQ